MVPRHISPLAAERLLPGSAFFLLTPLLGFPTRLYSAWLLARSASLLTNGNETYPQHTQRPLHQVGAHLSYGVGETGKR